MFRVPPQAVEVEKHVIGAMMLSSSSTRAGLKTLKADDFYLEKHQIIFQAIASMPQHEAVDLITISEQLKRLQTYDLAGGDDYLMSISSEVVSDANIKQHAEIVLEKSMLRRLIGKSTEILEDAYQAERAAGEILERAETDLAILRRSGNAGAGLRVVPREEVLQTGLDSYDATLYRGESTGWAQVDEHLRIAPGQMNVITGVPNHGKSEWLDALAINLAFKSNWRIAFFSPENSPLRRHIQKLAEKVVGRKLYGERRMSRDELRAALGNFILDRFVFLDQGMQGATFDQVLGEFARIRPKVQMAIIDPWNRLEHVRQDKSETDYVLEALRRGQRFCQATDVNLWLVAHPAKLTRDKMTHQLVKPGLYDISGSAHWGNVCDNGVMIWRDFDNKRTEVHLLKVRFKDNGHPGMVLQKYEIDSGRFSDFTEADHVAAAQAAQAAAHERAQASSKKKKGGSLPPDAGKQIAMLNASGRTTPAEDNRDGVDF